MKQRIGAILLKITLVVYLLNSAENAPTAKKVTGNMAIYKKMLEDMVKSGNADQFIKTIMDHMPEGQAKDIIKLMAKDGDLQKVLLSMIKSGDITKMIKIVDEGGSTPEIMSILVNNPECRKMTLRLVANGDFSKLISQGQSKMMQMVMNNADFKKLMADMIKNGEIKVCDTPDLEKLFNKPEFAKIVAALSKDPEFMKAMEAEKKDT